MIRVSILHGDHLILLSILQRERKCGRLAGSNQTRQRAGYSPPLAGSKPALTAPKRLSLAM